MKLALTIGPLQYTYSHNEAFKTAITDGDSTTCTDIGHVLRSLPGNCMTLSANYYVDNTCCYQSLSVNIIIESAILSTLRVFSEIISVVTTTSLSDLTTSSNSAISYDLCTSDNVHLLSVTKAEKRYRCQCDSMCNVQIVIDTSLLSDVDFSICEVTYDS